ncbi:MAG: hypothetical protein HS099_01900 [Ardenticatenaceae bacterium]|nr:hypothetical protein [Ardenticatenaceae bacterium]
MREERPYPNGRSFLCDSGVGNGRIPPQIAQLPNYPIPPLPNSPITQ